MINDQREVWNKPNGHPVPSQVNDQFLIQNLANLLSILSSRKNVNNEDVPTSAEQGEEGAFLDAVMDSAVMQEAYNFLSQTSEWDKESYNGYNIIHTVSVIRDSL